MTPKYKRNSPEHQRMMRGLIDRAVDHAANTSACTDAEVRAAIERVKAMPEHQRYDAFDTLSAYVQNSHPRGRAADIFQEVEDAWTSHARKR